MKMTLDIHIKDEKDSTEIKETGEMFDIFFESNLDAIVVTGREGRYKRVNDAACKLLGYPRSDLLKMSVQDLATPSSQQNASVQFQEYLTEKRMMGDFTFITGTGEVKIAEFTAYALDDDTHISILRDKTDIRLQQERHQILDTALSQTKEAIIISRADTSVSNAEKVIYVSDAFMKLTGYTSEDDMDIVPTFLEGSEPDIQLWKSYRDSLKDSKPVHGEIVCYRKDGSAFWCEIDISPVKDELGICRYYTTVLKDISNRIALENAVTKGMEEEKKYSRMLSQLHSINLVLARCNTLDELCREAVSLGTTQLGLGRVGIWFLTQDHKTVKGTYGTDEQGKLRDERGLEWNFDMDSHSEKSIRNRYSFSLAEDIALLDDCGKEVGRGSQVIAPLWSGTDILGFVAVDNLLSSLPYSEKDCEIIRQYTNTIGHLCAVLKTKQNLEESELRYRNLFEGFPLASIVYNKATRKIIGMNREAVSSYGYSKEQLLAMQISDLEAGLIIEQEQRHLSLLLNCSMADISIHRTLNNQLIDVKISSQDINIDGEEACLVTMQDITELKAAITQVNKNERRIQALLDHSTDGYVVLNDEIKVIDASKSLYRLSGYTVEDFQSPTYFSISHPEDKFMISNAIELVKKEKFSSYSLEFRALHKEQRWMWIEGTFTNLLDDENVAGIVLNFREITEKKRAEEEKNRIFDLSRSLILIHNYSIQFILFNPAWERDLGWSLSQLKEIGLQNLVHPDDSEAFLKYLKELDSLEPMSDFECRMKCSDGDYVWLNWYSLIQEGVLYATAHNVTRTKKMQKELQQSEEQIRQIFESITEAVIALDVDWNFTYINNPAEVMLGTTRESLLGKNLWEVYPDARNTVYEVEYRKAVETGISKTFEAYFPPIDAWLGVHLYPHESGLSIYFQNVSEQHKEKYAILDQNYLLEEKVRERTAQLTNAMKELESFSYSISHDLRAPLRAISGYARILEDGHADILNPEALNCISVIRKGVTHMGLLIDEILEFSRLGRKEIKRTWISLNPLVEEIVKGLQTERRVVEVTIHKLPDCVGDMLLIKQVYVNLLSNAFKFTKNTLHPHITIGTRQDSNETIYYVEDNGVGFDMRYVHKLFGVFQRLHRAEDYEGTGVGLAIVQRIIEKHGGRVWAEGRPDEGATFSFSLGSE